jgi:transcription elongation factor SPT5
LLPLFSARGGKFFQRQGKFLRPENADADEDEESSEDDDEEEPAPKPKVNNKADANLSSDDDDDDDDDEEEEEEEEDTRKRKKGGDNGKSSKRVKMSSFFDEEAEDDDEDDEEEEVYGTHHDPDDVVRKHYSKDEIRREQMDEEAREIIRQQDRRRAQAGNRFGRDEDDDPRAKEKSVQDLARDIEDRHRMQRRTVDRSMLDHPQRASHVDDEEQVGGPEVYSAVSQQSLVPSVSDPSLWMISCATGKEQDLIYQLMNKCTAFARQGRPLGICGAIAGQTKGRIYIESFSEPAVVEAIQGVRGLLSYTMRLIPIGDMTTVMTVVPKKRPGMCFLNVFFNGLFVELMVWFGLTFSDSCCSPSVYWFTVKMSEWVRMTRGHYKGDLALVKAVRESGLKCIVQCVPRLDLTLSDLPPEEARIRRRTVRPPQKFFSPQEIAAMGKQTLRRQRFPAMDIFCDYFENNYYNDGYLLKEMTVGSMIKPCTDEDPPTLDELQSFRRRSKGQGEEEDGADENEGSKMAASLLDELSDLQGKTRLAASKSGAPAGGLLIGDTIEVIEGDLVGMRGKLMSMDGTTVKVKPNDAALDIGGTGEIEFLSSQVRKYIAVGAHVKVTDGRYANETGVVVAVEQMEGEPDFTAVVLTDVTNKEISGMCSYAMARRYNFAPAKH